MKKQLYIIAFAAALAGCDNPTEVVGGSPVDPRNEQQLANAVANVDLPPAIVASRKYRCGDNGILAIDWMSDGTANSARATPEGQSGVNLVQAEPDGDYTAEGATLKGSPQADEVTFNGQSCKR